MSHSKSEIKNNLFLPFLFVLLIWMVKLVEILFTADFAPYGILPRTYEGLKGILFYPLIHGDFSHLYSNSVPIIVLGFITFQSYKHVRWRVLTYIYILSGMGIWLFARSSYHIGASGIVYGLAFFVFFSGVFRKDIRSMALALLVAFLYGSMVWGLFPLKQGVSWEGHLFGALAGAYCAFFYRKVNLPEPKVWDEPEDDFNQMIIEEPFWIDKSKIEEAGPKIKVNYVFKKKNEG